MSASHPQIEEVKETVEQMLATLQYGSVTIIVQDGHVVQIDKNEKHRIK
ncbi:MULTISPECIES: YezD family protein [Geomicrobium]|uniref:DUF2292 domain-containing protein n=1 Tax=Geomicrobium sediminis TaxID=1347788 RepID=A0ABS2PB62_9BACL|nr:MULTISPECIES: YezD family protein [Geomicrobium]MBM7632320.1 hypothetical protein [Geomicrobium sediminis]